jgi:uncharacterized membrane protein YfcA
MDQDFLVLNFAVFSAAALQSATGIGFGVIAGPILLIMLNDASAIQISIVLNLLIAAILTPSLWQQADRQLLRKLSLGLAIGSPLGLLVFLSMDIVFLKVFAGLAVTLTLFLTLRSNRTPSHLKQAAPGKVETISIGVVAGIMGASLAMPGPVPAAWMSTRGYNKDTIRATILVMFVFAYAVALLLQFGVSGIGADAFRLCAMLTPSTVVGIIAGRWLSSRLTERTFRWLLAIILASTALILFSTLIGL